MQAVKDKLNDMSAMRKAKADAKAEEKAEKDLAKARVEIAHEVRLAKEAEATMDLHVAKAQKKAEREMAKHAPQVINGPSAGVTTDYSGNCDDDYWSTRSGANCPTSNATDTGLETDYPTNTAGAPGNQTNRPYTTGGPTTNNLL